MTGDVTVTGVAVIPGKNFDNNYVWLKKTQIILVDYHGELYQTPNNVLKLTHMRTLWFRTKTFSKLENATSRSIVQLQHPMPAYKPCCR